MGRRPTHVGWSEAASMAGMNANWHTVSRRRLVDGPIIFLAQRHVTRRQQQDLNETAIGGTAIDFGNCKAWLLHRNDDRGTQSLVLIEPIVRHPLVDSLADGGAEIGVEDDLPSIDRVANGDCHPALVEHVPLQHAEMSAGLAVSVPPIAAA